MARSSSRWPSTPCSGLFSSWAMPATNCPSAASFSDCVSRCRSSSRSASSLRLRRQVARDDDAADALAFVIEQVGDRHHERPFSTGSTTSQRHRGVAVRGGSPAARARRATAPAPGRRTRRAAGRAARSRVRPTRLANAWLTCTIRPRAIGRPPPGAAIESKVFSSSRRDRIDVVEQLHVLDRARELAAELVGAIEQVELAAGLDAHAFEDDRAERAAGSRAAAR